ncbi:MAG: hypothetical protein ACK5L3_00350 [Oscillospiraceae bacterium]
MKKTQTPRPGTGAAAPPGKDKGFFRRTVALLILALLLALIFVLRLGQFQLLNGAEYLARAGGGAASSSSEARLEPAVAP